MHAVHEVKKISCTAEKLHAHVHVNQRNIPFKKTKVFGPGNNASEAFKYLLFIP